MAAKKTQEIFGSASNSGASNATVATSASTRQRIGQNYVLVWVDANIDQTNKDCQNTLTQLRAVVNDVVIFNQSDACVQFLDKLKDDKALVITSGSLGPYFLVPAIHHMPKLDAIYIFYGDVSYHQQWIKNWKKIKGVHNNIKDICDALKGSVKQMNQDSISISFVTMNKVVSSENLNQLEPSYMYTQIFKEILLKMEHDHKQAVKDLSMYYRKIYHANTAQLNIIHEFEHEYRREQAIWWYTRQSFTYEMLNRALRTLDADTIINMGFFLHDLHQQINQLHQQQLSKYHGHPFTVYRGQGLLKTDFDKLRKIKGGLMSFNNFLSTSNDQDVSFLLADSASGNPNMVGILFIMTIDPRLSSTPFASIKDVSYFNTEEEILFSMHTVFRVGEITQMDNNDQIYKVELKLTADDDEQLRELTQCISKEIGGGTGWERLGNLLLKTGHFDKAEELYKVLLEQPSSESGKASYYNNLGGVKKNQGDYDEAIKYYKQGLGIYEKTLPANHPYVAASYNNIGGVYHKMAEYSKSLLYHEKALETWKKTLPTDHPLLATSYSNIGGVYDNMGEYSKALFFFEKALKTREKILLANHPLLATSYTNIGGVYHSMGEYSKSLSFFEKALGIKEKTLPADHPDLAASNSNIGLVYSKMGEHSKSLSFHKKALGIREKTLPSNHLSLAIPYNNIGSTYHNMREYSEALSFYEKAREIFEKTLPADHPSLATSYNNIGSVYSDMGEYSKALSFFDKTHEIFEKTLSPSHPSLAISHGNIGGVYCKMEEYSKALSFYEKAFEIQKTVLPANHSDLATSCNNIGFLYKIMKEYSKALSYFERALDIWQSALPSNHPDLKNVKENIEIIKKKL
ncbi:unnamed protein product [Adineta steineri]|uniref:NAD(P)(+)--arginine ADP-ribosyltransferase n=1 Tax=Adineta steineri TaxID=433720 RepID=A0A819FFG0_9BILA|nr:unnamed protein product [Adineta steineri]CAF3867203.1 unnamed protein product [Adineta steineri]